ncbi:MAG: cytochrome c3 family protein [Planctomycetota bacterium]|jgi:predicted CXXCH cytochrome family protein
MKRVLFLFSVLAVVALGTMAYGQSTIVGSAHDFSGSFGSGRICVPCHTPHNAYPYTHTVERVLWNHEETTQTFTMYTTLTGNQGTPDGTSIMCLSCHDGVTAMDNYGGNSPGLIQMSGTAVVGIDLTDDHPIGIVYPASDPNYQSTPLNGLPLYNDGTDDRVECSSCHDAHGAGFADFLRDNTSGSQLCLDCHDK